MPDPAPDANPLGLNGFAFVEFTGPDAGVMAAALEKLGFTAAAHHPARDVVLYRQGEARFLLNRAATRQARDFAAQHGPSANGMGFVVADPEAALALAVRRGAEPVADALFPHALQGIGGALLYLVAAEAFADWPALPGAGCGGVGFRRIDHLTHNVRRGRMRHWSDFYRNIFGFSEQRYFDIKGQASGLFSQAMIAPDKTIRIPLNESQDDRSQIEEFLTAYNGEGIQHIALTTDDIYATVEALRARGVALQDTPDAYYDLVDRRVPGHGEDLARMRENRILIDGDVEKDGVLLQIFTENTFGPIFFEIIQRKGNDGFGNGNFQALFESIELDQIRRGVIKV